MQELFQLMLHADEHIAEIIRQYGTLTYIILFAIIFIETGLVIVTFFPGDGLLFSAGLLASKGELQLSSLLLLLSLATFLGHTSNYCIGRYLGLQFIKKGKGKRGQYLAQAQTFYENYQGKAIVVSRFIPFMRSFVPFVAGLLRMQFRYFTLYNGVGAILWVGIIVLLGFFIGEIPWVQQYYGLIFTALFLLLTISGLVGLILFLYKNKIGEKEN